MIIYSCTNTINKKMYIGATTDTLKNRIKSHKDRIKNANEPLFEDIRIFGLDVFEWKIISVCDDIQQLENSEKYFIEYYNSIYPNGYNLRIGGNHGTFCDFTKDKMSKSKSGDKNPNKKPERRKKISETMKKVCSEPEYRQKMIERANIINKSDEYKKNHSIIMKKWWDNRRGLVNEQG